MDGTFLSYRLRICGEEGISSASLPPLYRGIKATPIADSWEPGRSVMRGYMIAVVVNIVE